ncbi:MAG: hypothetical protein MZV65_31930 [Chromatiales bacterium]|nr:hypothetical protein [Chromatiales bacterium]
MLNQEQATLLMTYMRNSDVVRAFKKRLVKAFFEFARKAQSPAFAIPQTLPEALRLAADLAESNARQQARLAAVEPKAEALDLIATKAEGSLNLTNAAKTLQIGPGGPGAASEPGSLDLPSRRRRRAGVAYQDKLQQGSTRTQGSSRSRRRTGRIGSSSRCS